MTGMEILEGLSYVDEKYIQEAETATLGRNTQWMKVLSAVACLCILVTGVYAHQQMNMKSESAMEMEPAADAPAVGAPQAPAADCVTESATPEEAAGELHHVPGAKLRVQQLTEDGFVAVVEESDNCDFLTAGMQVQVTIDAGEVPGSEVSASMYGGITLPEEGLLVTVENGAFDAGANTLYVAGITVPDQKGED